MCLQNSWLWTSGLRAHDLILHFKLEKKRGREWRLICNKIEHYIASWMKLYSEPGKTKGTNLNYRNITLTSNSAPGCCVLNWSVIYENSYQALHDKRWYHTKDAKIKFENVATTIHIQILTNKFEKCSKSECLRVAIFNNIHRSSRNVDEGSWHCKWLKGAISWKPCVFVDGKRRSVLKMFTSFPLGENQGIVGS